MEKQQTVISKLSSLLGRRDEVPNQVLAKQIADAGDKKAVKELVDNLASKNKNIQSDCIKVLYEIGEQKPKLIADHVNEFVKLLDSKNNRLQWGAMTALGTITAERPKEIYTAVTKIISAAERGSVITKDHCVNILIGLCSVKQYADSAFPLLLEQLLKSPTNQLPMYAEKAMPIIDDKNRVSFIKVLTSRLGDVDKDTKRKRIEKVIKKVSGK